MYHSVKGFFSSARMWEKNYKTFFFIGLFLFVAPINHRTTTLSDDLFLCVRLYDYYNSLQNNKKNFLFFFPPHFSRTFSGKYSCFQIPRRLLISLARCRLSHLYSSIPNSLMCVCTAREGQRPLSYHKRSLKAPALDSLFAPLDAISVCPFFPARSEKIFSL